MLSNTAYYNKMRLFHYLPANLCTLSWHLFFLDLVQQQKGIKYEEWLELAKSDILAPTSEKQHFLDSIAVVQTTMLKTLGIKLPIESETKYIDMDMNAFDGAAATLIKYGQEHTK